MCQTSAWARGQCALVLLRSLDCPQTHPTSADHRLDSMPVAIHCDLVGTPPGSGTVRFSLHPSETVAPKSHQACIGGPKHQIKCRDGPRRPPKQRLSQRIVVEQRAPNLLCQDGGHLGAPPWASCDTGDTSLCFLTGGTASGWVLWPLSQPSSRPPDRLSLPANLIAGLSDSEGPRLTLTSLGGFVYAGGVERTAGWTLVGRSRD